MQMHVLKCPNCGANLDVEDGLDTFYCKYCGYKIVLEGQSDQAYKSKTRIKGMEHDERMLDKKLAHEKFKIKAQREKEAAQNKTSYVALIVGIAMIAVGLFHFGWSARRASDREEEKLQSIVDEVMVDIKNKDYDDAYIKAQSIVCTDAYSDEIEEKWDNTREEVIEQIEEAEKKDTGSVSHKQKKGLLKSIFGK